MAASGYNIESQIRVESTQLIKSLNDLSDDFFSDSEDTQKKNAAEKKVKEFVAAYYEFLCSLQPAQLASSNKFKLAVDTLEQTIERLSLQENDQYRGFTFHTLSAMIQNQNAAQQPNQNLLSTAIRQKVSEILISNLQRYNTYFFSAENSSEMHEKVKSWLVGALQDYYLVCIEEQDFAPTVNLFRALDEDKKRNFCTMVYYADQQWDLPDNTPSLSKALIKTGVITLEEIEKSLEAFSQPSDHSEDFFNVDDHDPDSSDGQSGQASSVDQSSQASRANEENDENGCWGTAPEIGCLGAQINDMSPEAQLGAAFFMFAMGALGVTAGVILGLILASSVIPSVGITSPIAIGGCVAAAAGIVAGVTLMVGGIKMAQNAFTLFASSDEVEKPSKGGSNCLRHIFW